MVPLRQTVMFTRGVAIAALPIATLEVSSELHALLRKIDPASFRDELEADEEQRCGTFLRDASGEAAEALGF